MSEICNSETKNIESSVEFYYKNGKGAIKPLSVSKHAAERLLSRWKAVYESLGDVLGEKHESGLFSEPYRSHVKDGNWQILLGILLQKGKRVPPTRFSKEQRKRNRSYGPSLRIRYLPFELIIQDSNLITVEIYQNDFRNLNAP